MSSQLFSVQEKTPFSKSLIWQINKDFYHQNGIAAWSEGIVPHKITNSSLAATTYAELIYAFLKDLANSGETNEVVYLLELGAGHGRLCFNILEHLDRLVSSDSECSTQYCYILSDIVEENLSFFSSHPKLQKYFDRGVLDISYFDGSQSQELTLRKSNITISQSDLAQPILTIANYFLDSLPNELFYIENKTLFECSVSIDSSIDPKGQSAHDLIDQMQLTFHKTKVKKTVFDIDLYNDILAQYTVEESQSYILFPKEAFDCLNNISSLSKSGLVLLTLDKGYKEMHELMGRSLPDIVKHGSFSVWVNFHALSQYCVMSGGVSLFDSSTNLSVDLGCLIFSKQPFKHQLLEKMYRKHSKQLNLDDFNSIKKLVYKNLPTANLSELLGLIRLSAYDSAIFINLLSNIKLLSKNISVRQRSRLRQTIDFVWLRHYAINKDYDFSYELGGLMYDLGDYTSALKYYGYSTDTFGNKVDVYHNQILCYYQLRQDDLFYKTLSEAQLIFPLNDALMNLEKLDMN